MNYEAIEDDIVARLASLNSAVVDAVPLPDTEDELRKPFQRARVTVAYKGSKFGDRDRGDLLRSTAEIGQLETLKFEIIVQSRQRRGQRGVYAVYDEVRTLLVGYKPANCNRMYLSAFEYADYKEGIWSYTACMECTRLVVEDAYSSNDSDPLASQFRFDEKIDPDLLVK